MVIRMEKTKLAIAALLLALSSLAAAGEYNTEILYGFYTDHLNKGDFNEENHLVGIRHKSFVAGTFENSYHQRTYFAGYLKEWNPRPNLILGGVVGGMHGYCWEAFEPGKAVDIDNCRPATTPMLSGWVGYQFDRVSVRIAIMATAVEGLGGYGFNMR